MPLVELSAVRKHYAPPSPVLDDVTLSVAQNDFVSFIGPSGCGKSTLLRLIAGLIAPSSGTVRVDGQSPGALRERLAFVFQDATLLPWLNVEENLALPLRLRGAASAEIAAACERGLNLVGLLPQRRHFPRQLSGGQRMRVSLARALAVAPELLLLDEPFGALDEMTRERLNEELLALREQQRWTALFVTHSVAEAVFLSNRVIVLSAGPGRIAADIPVALPYPRSAETRLTNEFLQSVRDVSRALRAVENPRR